MRIILKMAAQLSHAGGRRIEGLCGVNGRLDPMIAGPEGGPSSDMQRYEG